MHPCNLKQSVMRRIGGFTLIELLIVVAIIAILAAIAVPNFLEAQTRSKVSRAKADLRTLATALESYRVDANKYPYPTQRGMQLPLTFSRITEISRYESGTPFSPYGAFSEELTTPIAYISSLPTDVFKEKGYNVSTGTGGILHPAWHPWRRYSFGSTFSGIDWSLITDYPGTPAREKRPDLKGKLWLALSLGPDRKEDIFSPWTMAEYDPTNGTTSGGDITRSGP
jgi:prepilin-type N-terminal cleavage/methylation domain-containing protein